MLEWTRTRVVSRRDVVRLGLSSVGLIALGAACAPAPPAPTAAPAKPAEAAKPAAPAPAATAAPAAAAPAATTAPAVKPATSGKVVIMTGGEPPNLDAVIFSAGVVRTVTQDNIYEGLLTVDTEMQVLPNLAISWDRVDPTRMRFKLQQGVKFHNGERFTADSVVATVRRMLDPAANATVISYLDTLAGAEAVDEHTVDILTKGPDPILARRMSFAMIGPAEVLAKAPDSLADKPIGTGPYKLTEWIKGSKISMTANEEYWGPTKPTIKDVEFQPRKESSVRLTAIKAGEAHLAEYITPEDAGTLPKEQVLSGLSVECMQLRPNTKAGITSDLGVRQAISYSIDRENLTKSIFGPYAELPNGQLYAKTSFAYDPNMRDVPFDLDKAKSLVKEAGAEGKEVSIVGIASDRFVKGREVQEAVAAMIGKTGLVVNLKLVESADWIKSLYEIQNPPMDIWFGSAGNEMQDGDRIFGSYIKTGGRAALYSNPEVDQWIDASRAELDTAKRAALIQQIARKIQTDVALIPLVQLQNIYGISPKLKFEIYPSAIAPAARMQLSG